ncbi:hypothetical protein NIE79_004582 [Micromonospora sp. NIE79]|uniref:LPXTG cell wall anchor domain-containing protein n=1 Tax=Micromonospora trifolii TaxID=2911208 RepID=A0ABS9N855_9ACTN|nr:hypothetical protein [Micromonospora trifolii]MCG5446018.1 hypothetical protein [Micromonospora trifolii]
MRPGRALVGLTTSALSRGDIIGLVLGGVFVVGGALLLTRSGKIGRVKEVAATRRTS